jgi:hypothetical protein
MNEKHPSKTRKPGKLLLLFSTFLSAIASLLGFFMSTVYSEFGRHLARIHWTLWVAFALGVYLLICYLVACKKSGSSVIKKIFSVPLWSSLRAFGEQPAAKISYWVLIFVPVIVYATRTKTFSIIAKDFELPLNLKLSYFASWFIAIALVLFKVSCPQEARKIHLFEKIRSVNIVLNNVPEPRIVVQSENEEVNEIVDGSLLEMRALCFSFYAFGTVTFLMVLLRSADLVLSA